MNRLLFLVLVCLALLVTGCKKNDDSDDNGRRVAIDTDTQSAQDYSTSDAEANKTIDFALRAYEELRSGKSTDLPRILPECAWTSLDTSGSTHRLTIDFGTEGCLCANWDGRIRRGKLFINFTGRYITPGSEYRVQSLNYYVGDNEHRINHLVRNIGPGASNQPRFQVSISDTVLTRTGAIRLQAERLRTWVEGSNTLNNPWDDVYEINDQDAQRGSTGVNRRGESFRVRITTPLRVVIDCREKVVSGVLELTPSQGVVRLIDYGRGACDGLLTVVIRNRAFTLPIYG
jgi:hypothetical protein